MEKHPTVLYYVTLAFVLLSQFSTTQTLWVKFTRLGIYARPLSILLLVLLFSICISNYRGRQQILLLLTFFLVMVVSWSSGYYHGFLLFSIFVLAIAAKGIEFRSIVKFHLVASVFFLCINLTAHTLQWTDKSLLFLGDTRENLFGGDEVVRYSGGYPASTDFATHIVYMLIDYWILKYGKLHFFTFVCYLGIILALIYYCDARQAAGCGLLILLFTVYLKRVDRRGRLNKISAYALILGVPLFFAISLYATFAYDNSDIIWVGADVILSGRLHFSSEAIDDFGLNMFGNDIELIGAGFESKGTYNYVDNAYVQFLLRWGFLMMGLFLLAFTKLAKDAWSRKDYVLLFSIFIAGVSSLITQFLFYLHYCILILALFSKHTDLKEDRLITR